MMNDIPNSLKRDPNFSRYLNKWAVNEASIVFIPLAEILRKNGLLDKALDVCRKGLGFHPESVSGRLQLARILADRNDIAEARKVLLDILSCIPDQADAKEILERLKKKEKVDCFETFTMAKICLDQGDSRRALAILETVLARDPGNREAKEKWLELRKG